MDKRDARGRPRRTALVLPVAVVLVLAACGGGAPPAPPAPPEDVVVRQGIERILELSDVDGLLAGRARAFTRQVAIMLLDPTDEELERLVPAVLDAFDHEALKEDVATRMAVDADPSVVSSVLEWMEAGSTAAVRRIADGYEPPLTLEEYATGYTEDPPSEARVRLMAEWAEAQGRGDFFVLMQEALREASFRVHDAMRGGAPAFEPLDADELGVAQTSSHGASVITLLHRYETVPEPLVRRSIAEYRTESGQWFTEAYTLAVAQAIRAAGERVADRLSDGGR